MPCKTSDNKCIDPRHTQLGKCRTCPFCRATRPSNAQISMLQYQFLLDMCKGDPGHTVQSVCEYILEREINFLIRAHEKEA